MALEHEQPTIRRCMEPPVVWDLLALLLLPSEHQAAHVVRRTKVPYNLFIVIPKSNVITEDRRYGDLSSSDLFAPAYLISAPHQHNAVRTSH